MSAHDPYCPVTQTPDKSPWCACIALATARKDTADIIRDRIDAYAATLNGRREQNVALTCASLSTVAGLR